MPEQQSYRVTRPDGTVQVFPPGTPEEVLMAWYNGDDKVAPRGEINPMAMLGQETPPGMDLKGIGGDIGAVIEFLSGFTPFRPIPAALGMGASAIGELMQGGDAGDAAVSAGITGAGSGLGRLISQTGTTLGLKMGGHHDDAWKTAGDFYNLRPFGPTAIGQGKKIQREVTRSGENLSAAQAKAKPVKLKEIAGANNDVAKKSLQARGGYPQSFKRGLDDAERKFIKEQLVEAGWARNAVNRFDDQMLDAFAGVTDVPMQRIGSIKTDMQLRGKDALTARQDRAVTAPRIQAQAQHADEVAAKARKVQRGDPNVKSALDRNARAQRVKSANTDVQHKSSLPYLLNNGSGAISAALRSSVGRPSVISHEARTLDQIVRAILSGAKLPQGGGDR